MPQDILIDEALVKFSPTMAKIFGEKEAMILQKIHGWLWYNRNDPDKRETHFFEGKWWSYNTYANWNRDFDWWSRSTLERTFASLKQQGLIETKGTSATNEKGNWVTINYDYLNATVYQRRIKARQNSDKSIPHRNLTRVSSRDPHQDDVSTHVKLTTHSENSFSENNKQRNRSPDGDVNVFDEKPDSKSNAILLENPSNFPLDDVTQRPKQTLKEDLRELVLHPLVLIIAGLVNKPLTRANYAQLEQEKNIVEDDSSIRHCNSRLFMYDSVPGFSDFVLFRVKAYEGMITRGGNVTANKFISDLLNENRHETGWQAWRKQNPLLTTRNKDGSMPSTEELIYDFD